MRSGAALLLGAGATGRAGESAPSRQPAGQNTEAPDDPGQWLDATRLIDKDHPSIRRVALEVTRGTTGERARALALFAFVSTQIEFGFCRGFWDNRASAVLRQRRGYCNTKSTLFVALLRALGIPARQVFVDIDARVLAGLLDPGTPLVDHSYVEVHLDGAWRATDAYIVDPPLFRAGRARLLQSGETLGFGCHREGSTQWDGLAPSFSQYPVPAGGTVGGSHHGAYDDVADFYQRVPAAWNRLNPLLRSAVGLFSSGANRSAARLRLEHLST